MAGHIDPPRRQTVDHRCRCVVVCPEADALLYGVARGRCGQTASPDSPFCDGCEDRHPHWTARGVIVRVAPLPAGLA